MKEIKDVSELKDLPVGTEVKFGDMEFMVYQYPSNFGGDGCKNCIFRYWLGDCKKIPCGEIGGFVYLPITKKAEQPEAPKPDATDAEYYTAFIAQSPKNIETARGLLAELMNTETDKDKLIILEKIYELI